MSFDSLDCFEHGMTSDCCGARVMLGQVCAACKEHCSIEGEREDCEERIEGIKRAWAEQDRE